MEGLGEVSQKERNLGRTLFRWHSKPLNNKCFECFGFKRWDFWLIVSIETSYRTDQWWFFLVICTLKVEFNFYDIRHWNDAAGRYNLGSEYQTTVRWWSVYSGMPKRTIIFGNAFQYEPSTGDLSTTEEFGSILIGQLDKYLSQDEVQAAIRECNFLEQQSYR